MSLHDRIMACLECPPVAAHDKAGYAMGISDSANLVKEADDIMAEMAEDLSLYVKAGHGMSTDFQQQGDAKQSALYALDRYKESTK